MRTSSSRAASADRCRVAPQRAWSTSPSERAALPGGKMAPARRCGRAHGRGPDVARRTRSVGSQRSARPPCAPPSTCANVLARYALDGDARLDPVAERGPIGRRDGLFAGPPRPRASSASRRSACIRDAGTLLHLRRAGPRVHGPRRGAGIGGIVRSSRRTRCRPCGACSAAISAIPLHHSFAVNHRLCTEFLDLAPVMLTLGRARGGRWCWIIEAEVTVAQVR